MGGLPLSFGFFAKETMYDALLHGEGWGAVLLATTVAGNALLFSAAFAVALVPFLGPHVKTPRHPHEGSPGLWLGPAGPGPPGVPSPLPPAWAGGAPPRPPAPSRGGRPAGAPRPPAPPLH